jgi:hypothetical protein
MTARPPRLLELAWAILALGALASPGAAQEAPEPSTGAEFWYGAGVGAGSARFTCDPCSEDRDGGPSIRVALGATARPGLRVGVAGGTWRHRRGGLEETARHLGLMAALDVRPGSAVHLIGGAGWVGWRSDEFAYDALDLSVGAGWSVPLVGRWALTNSVLLHAASFGKLRNDEAAAVRDVSLSLASFEIGLFRR